MPNNEFPDFSFLGTNIECVLKAVKEERYVKISSGKCRLELPKKRQNPVVDIIPISQGCLGNCSYCIVKRTRGGLDSCREELILSNVEKAVLERVGEIWLTAQDTGAYGFDTGGNLPSLLNKISKIGGDFRVRVGMMNPNHALEFMDELIKSYTDEKIYKFLHIPLQSGNDGVLKDMNRRYTINDFRRIISKFRRNFNHITISTDVILGFPTETEEAFQNTLRIIRETKPEVLNISRFWLRPGTKAGKFKQLPTRITKERSRLMNSIFREYALKKNKEWVGWEGKVLVSRKSKSGTYTGRNFAYKPVIIKSDENLIGKFIWVRINDATYYDLRGEII